MSVLENNDLLAMNPFHVHFKAARSLGISFQIWNKKDSKVKDCTSLMRNEKEKLLKDLPAKFHEILRPETGEKPKKLWEVCLSGIVLSIRAGSRPKQPATGQSLASYFHLT